MSTLRLTVGTVALMAFTLACAVFSLALSLMGCTADSSPIADASAARVVCDMFPAHGNFFTAPAYGVFFLVPIVGLVGSALVSHRQRRRAPLMVAGSFSVAWGALPVLLVMLLPGGTAL